MALTTPQGPLGTDPAGWFSEPLPAGVVYVESHPGRIQAVRDGRTVIDTEQAVMVHRPDRIHRYAFLADEVGDLPHKPEPAAPGYVVVPWGAVDTWFERGVNSSTTHPTRITASTATARGANCTLKWPARRLWIPTTR